VNDESFIDKYSSFFLPNLVFLLAKKQYHAVRNIFENNASNLKERFKPTYYAAMYFLKDEFPNEYLKMGEELKQTVDEIIQKVHQREKDYA